MNSATQISIIPFMLNGPFSMERQGKSFLKFLAKFSCVAQDATIIEAGVLGSKFRCYCTADESSAKMRLFINEWGAAAFVVIWPEVLLERGLIALLELRRNRHIALLSRVDVLGARCFEMATALREAIRPGIQFPGWLIRRPSIFSYVFSMWKLDGNDETQLKDAICALLHPSYYHVSDTSWDEPLQTSQKLKGHQEDGLNDIDSSPNIAAYTSWASVVLKNAATIDLVEFYIVLEVRLQALWMFAHCVANTDTGVRGLDISSVELLTGLFERAIGELRGISDPMANERVLGVQGELVRTSNLDTVVNEGRHNLTTLGAIADARASKIRARSDAVLQFLLFVIASLQIVPLVIKIPLESFAGEIVSWAWAAMFVLFIGSLLRR